MSERPESEAGGLRGIHVLLCMIAFFGLIFAVNGFFLYSALATHTGIVSKQPYRKGLEYNQRIAADEQQQKLGWTEEVRFDREAGRLVVTFKDREGGPVTGLAIAGLMGRPSTAKHDANLLMAETQSGRYEANVGARQDGVWLVQLEASSEHKSGEPKTVYRLRKRLWLKQ